MTSKFRLITLVLSALLLLTILAGCGAKSSTEEGGMGDVTDLSDAAESTGEPTETSAAESTEGTAEAKGAVVGEPVNEKPSPKPSVAPSVKPSEGVTEGTTELPAVAPMPPSFPYPVKFQILENLRIEPPYDERLHLIRSREDMSNILSAIDASGLNSALSLDENYNDAYFAEHYLIVFTSVVGGGGCFQTIDQILLEKDQLLVCRTTHRQKNPVPDMNYRYVLIEVDNTYLTKTQTLHISTNVVLHEEP